VLIEAVSRMIGQLSYSDEVITRENNNSSAQHA
jgi:hypothetical protein